MGEVVRLPAAVTCQTSNLALETAKLAKLKETIVLGVDRNGDFFFNTSQMNKKDALWLLETAKTWIMKE